MERTGGKILRGGIRGENWSLADNIYSSPLRAHDYSPKSTRLMFSLTEGGIWTGGGLSAPLYQSAPSATPLPTPPSSWSGRVVNPDVESRRKSSTRLLHGGKQPGKHVCCLCHGHRRKSFADGFQKANAKPKS